MGDRYAFHGVTKTEAFGGGIHCVPILAVVQDLTEEGRGLAGPLASRFDHKDKEWVTIRGEIKQAVVINFRISLTCFRCNTPYCVTTLVALCGVNTFCVNPHLQCWLILGSDQKVGRFSVGLRKGLLRLESDDGLH